MLVLPGDDYEANFSWLEHGDGGNWSLKGSPGTAAAAAKKRVMAQSSDLDSHSKHTFNP